MTNIYPSTKVRPYVYICIDKETAQFYIGYREINKVPSHLDLPKYKTSSKVVKPKFDNFNYQILAEFEIGNDAYDFEQQLIFENWGNPLLLNEHCFYGKNRFKTVRGKTQSTEHVAKRVAKNTEKIRMENANIKRRLKLIGITTGPQSTKTKEKRSLALKNKPKTVQHNANVSAAKKGIPWSIARRNAQKSR